MGCGELVCTTIAKWSSALHQECGSRSRRQVRDARSDLASCLLPTTPDCVERARRSLYCLCIAPDQAIQGPYNENSVTRGNQGSRVASSRFNTLLQRKLKDPLQQSRESRTKEDVYTYIYTITRFVHPRFRTRLQVGDRGEPWKNLLGYNARGLLINPFSS